MCQNAAVAVSPNYPIRSSRLLLWPLDDLDIAALVAYRSLPEVCRYVPFDPMDAAQVTAHMRGPYGRSTFDVEGNAIFIGAALADTKELVGDVMLRWASREHRSGEVGYVFSPRFSGQGYATEAVHMVLHIGFEDLDLHRIFARVDARNSASARLARRLGMRQEAHLRDNEWFKGGWSDELDFALLEPEWQEQHLGGCSAAP